MAASYPAGDNWLGIEYIGHMQMLRSATIAGVGILAAGGLLFAQSRRRKPPHIAKAFTIERSAADL
jgi:hypothetical protein